MMKKAFTTCCLVALSALPLKGQSAHHTPMKTLRKPLVSIGVKAGFNSSIFFTDRLLIGGQEITGVQNNYKVGYFAAAFCRFNLKKHHFIQPEFSYNISKGSIAVRNNPENSELISSNALIKTTISSFDFPILYGYKFVDVHPYGMAFFVGPKVSYRWNKQTKNEYFGFYQKEIHEVFHPWNYRAVVGLAVNVSNIFFDFRYEAALHHITDHVTYNKDLTESPHRAYDIQVKRRYNTMSFSVGVIF